MNTRKKLIIIAILTTALGSIVSVYAMDYQEQHLIEQAQCALGLAIRSGDTDNVIKALENPLVEINGTVSGPNLFSHPIETNRATPLSISLENNNPRIVELLIAKNANIEQINSIRWTPLDTATMRAFKEITWLLSYAGAQSTMEKKNGKKMETIIIKAREARQKEPENRLARNNALYPIIAVPGIISIINAYAAASYSDIQD
ncbi:MAG: hypothetical protein NT124_03540 [Candidatus Dependentiae bacterium]|nr:hypothetical protein [Candidatus Dependentiae bacterium]